MTEGFGDRPSAPLTWEEKAAIGCLVVLSTQALYEGFHLFAGDIFPRMGKIHSVFLLLLGIYIALGVGLSRRNNVAWWFSVLGVALFGALLTHHTWNYIHPNWRNWGVYREWDEDSFEFFWLVARNALLLAVPSLLLLGVLRRTLQRR